MMTKYALLVRQISFENCILSDSFKFSAHLPRGAGGGSGSILLVLVEVV